MSATIFFIIVCLAAVQACPVCSNCQSQVVPAGKQFYQILTPPQSLPKVVLWNSIITSDQPFTLVVNDTPLVTTTCWSQTDAAFYTGPVTVKVQCPNGCNLLYKWTYAFVSMYTLPADSLVGNWKLASTCIEGACCPTSIAIKKQPDYISIDTTPCFGGINTVPIQNDQLGEEWQNSQMVVTYTPTQIHVRTSEYTWDFTHTESADSSFNIYILIGIAAGGLIVILIAIYYIYRCISKKNQVGDLPI